MSLQFPVASRIRWILVFTALGVLCLTLATLSTSAGASPQVAHVQTDGVARLAARHPNRRAAYIVQVDAGADGDAVIARVRRARGRVTGRLPIINGFAAKLRARAAARLAAAPGVRAVTLNAGVEPQGIRTDRLKSAYPASVNAPQAWNYEGYNITGRGVGVAVIDTGIAGRMPDFSVTGSSTASRVVASAVTNPLARTAADSFGHGTHVAGIIAGNGNERSYNDPLRGQYVGIAPEANLISVKVSDDLGNATVLDVIYGLQFVVDHKSDYNIRVVNLSLESTTPSSYKTDPLDAAAEAAWFKGIVVVTAAGNRGSDGDAVDYAPGNDPYVISVGAVDDQESRLDGDDVRARWSSRGTTQDGHVKPEILAPGAGIVSTLAPGSAFATMCPTCVVSGQMIRAGGTSMSAPVVSGAVALMLQVFPSLKPDQVKGILTRSARMLNGKYPEVDVAGALLAAYYGRTSPANEGLVPNDVVDPATGAIDYTRSSWSRSSWSAAPGSLTAGWARSSWSCDCSLDASGDVLPSRSSWSRSSWSTSWDK